jgi:LacI family transcriptional regulator
MPTLQDVAHRAGVSTATVSKVLSNTPYFTDQTRAKVMQAVEELGYVPHLAARALSKGKTRIIAVVFPYLYDTLFSDPLVLRILEGIESETSRQGYNILLSTPRLNARGPDSHYKQLIQSGYIDGVIALDNVPFASVLDPVRKRGIPAVAIGYYGTDFRVVSDDVSGGFQLMTHVLGLGHRRVGIITVPFNIHYSIQHRIAGLRAGAEAVGVDFDAFPQVDGDFSTDSGEAGAAKLLDAHPDLTAIISLNDRMAMGAILAVRNRGREVPRDVTIVGYDDIPIAATISPPLTTIDQQAPELGRSAMRMLLDVFGNHSPELVKMPTRLIVRQSSAAPARWREEVAPHHDSR